MSAQLDRLRAIVAALRAPAGCPWDREQTHESLREGLLEESYEVIDAINRRDDENLREELGDLALQAVMHAQIAEEEGRFDIEAVLANVSDKLIRRHPHVFADATATDTGAVLRQWEEIKRSEKSASPDPTWPPSRLDHIAEALPALMRAAKVQKKAGRAGFDWNNSTEIVVKIREELDEVVHELQSGDRPKIEEEIGDLLFATANLARKEKLDPELLLRAATDKFERRFRWMEASLAETGQQMEDLSMEVLNLLWEQAKRSLSV